MHKLPIIIGTTLLLFTVGCADSALKLQGEDCFASSECDVGLVCDNGTCQTMLTPQPDANVTPPDDAMVSDAAPGTPDAMPQPDAPPGTPDAGIPDAMIVIPDAAIPDAALPDAAIFDAAP